MLQRLRDERDSQGRVRKPRVSDVILDLCGIKLSAEEAATLATAAGGPLPSELNNQHANASGIFAEVRGNQTGIGWTGLSHTSDVTMVLAAGPGQDRFAGLKLNTETSAALTAFMEVPFVNPAMSNEAAARYAPGRPEELSPHWL